MAGWARAAAHRLAGALRRRPRCDPRGRRTPRSAWRRRAHRSPLRRGGPARARRGSRSGPWRAASRRSSGRVSLLIALRIAPGSSERSVGFRSPASRMSRTPSWSRRTFRRSPPGVLTFPLIGLRPTLCTRLNEVVADARGDAGARAAGAQLAQRARHGLEGRDVQDVGALGRNDRVQHERLDVGRVLGGVVERDLGAVGDAEEDELLIAGLDAQGLDVVDRVRRAVEAARRPELVGARRRGVDDRGDAAVEGRAAEPARAAGAALVVDEQVARGQRGPEDRGELGGDGDAPPDPGRRPARRPPWRSGCWWRRRA